MALGDPGARALGQGRKPGAPARAGDGTGDRASLKARVGQGRSVRVDLRLAGPGEPRPRAKVASVPGGIEATLESDGTLLIHAGYKAPRSATITVNVTSGPGKTSPLTVAVEIAPLRWLPQLTWGADRGPEAREHGAFVIDEPRGRVLLIGGSGYKPQFTPLADVWQFRPATGTWSRLAGDGSIPGGGSRRVAQMPGQPVAYLFGGYGAEVEAQNEFYRVDYSADVPRFSKVAQENPPQPRQLHAFVYDPRHDRFLMFGGAGEQFFADTWVMKLKAGVARWTRLTLDPSPSPRYGSFFGFDAEGGRLILFSGFRGTENSAIRETWILEARDEKPAWRGVPMPEDPGVPPGRRNGCGVFDPIGRRLFVFGGTANQLTTEPGLFVFDARPEKLGWTRLELPGAPPLRSSGFGFYDRVSDRIFLGFGNTILFDDIRDLTPLGY
jgi:hypothetical protein